MKNIFAFNKDDENLDVDKYIIRKVEKDNEEQFDKLEEEGEKILKKYKTPYWVNIIMFIFIVGGLICILSMFSKKRTFIENYNDHGFVLYIGIALLIIGICLYALIFFRNKKIDKNPEVMAFIDKSNKLTKNALFELGVPEEAKSLDVLIYSTKTTKKNVEKEVNNFVLNFEVHLFTEENNLCLATTQEVIAFPKESFKDLVKIKRVSFLANWNKPEGSNSKMYKPFVKNTEMGLRIKYCYRVNLNYNDEELCFLIPDYDLATFLSVMDLEVKEGESNED